MSSWYSGTKSTTKTDYSGDEKEDKKLHKYLMKCGIIHKNMSEEKQGEIVNKFQPAKIYLKSKKDQSQDDLDKVPDEDLQAFLVNSGIIAKAEANKERGQNILHKFEYSKAWLEHTNQNKEEGRKKKKRPKRQPSSSFLRSTPERKPRRLRRRPRVVKADQTDSTNVVSYSLDLDNPEKISSEKADSSDDSLNSENICESSELSTPSTEGIGFKDIESPEYS